MIDKVKDPYSAILIIQWLKDNRQKFALSEEELSQAISDFYETLNIDKKTKDYVNSWIARNREILRGQAGQDGIGIEDIIRDKDDLLITLTDGTEKRIALPKPKIIQQGGGGVGAYFAMSTPVITINSDTALSAQTQNILVDASSGDVNVTLPNPIDFHSGGRSYKLSITRTDTTTNVCNILPYDSELILNDPTQTLLSSEVLNLISDNTNWYYGA